MAGDQARARGRAPRRTTGSPAALPALLLATKILERAPEAGSGPARRRTTDADLGDRLLALVAEAVAPASTPSRRCATPYAVPAAGGRRD